MKETPRDEGAPAQTSDGRMKIVSFGLGGGVWLFLLLVIEARDSIFVQKRGPSPDIFVCLSPPGLYSAYRLYCSNGRRQQHWQWLSSLKSFLWLSNLSWDLENSVVCVVSFLMRRLPPEQGITCSSDSLAMVLQILVGGIAWPPTGWMPPGCACWSRCNRFLRLGSNTNKSVVLR